MGKHSRTGAALALLLGAATACAEEPAGESSSLKESAKAAVSSAISAGKNLLGGASEGVTEGREATQGADGALIISRYEQLADKVEVKLLKVERIEGNLNALFGFKNLTDKPVRLINLWDNGALLAIDQEDYASNLAPDSANPEDVTVPAKIGVRQKFIFEGTVEGAKAVRLWGKDFPVAQ